MIDDVADQTNLLALNAAIIAAQAGEHGKSFSVVSQEIKELADRTAVSTKEIHEIITELQDQTQNASMAIRKGSKDIREGVRLSREATVALQKIQDSSLKSTERIQGIARTTDEQTQSVAHVAQAMQRINDMVQQIGRATHEQSRGSEAILAATEKVRDVASKVKVATQEQSVGNKHINEIMDQVNGMVKEIADATSRQSRESENIAKAMDRIQGVIEQNTKIIKKVGTAIDHQINQAESLSTEIEIFNL